MKLLDVHSPEDIPKDYADPEKAKEEKRIPAEIGLCYCNQLFHTERLLKGEISNNRAERCAKAYGTGRKNFLFHNSVDGAKSSAIIYSLVETAKANKLNVFLYLYILLLYMPDYKDEPAGVEAMMPWSDFIKEHCTGLTDTETIMPENRGKLPI